MVQVKADSFLGRVFPEYADPIGDRLAEYRELSREVERACHGWPGTAVHPSVTVFEQDEPVFRALAAAAKKNVVQGRNYDWYTVAPHVTVYFEHGGRMDWSNFGTLSHDNIWQYETQTDEWTHYPYISSLTAIGVVHANV